MESKRQGTQGFWGRISQSNPFLLQIWKQDVIVTGYTKNKIALSSQLINYQIQAGLSFDLKKMNDNLFLSSAIPRELQDPLSFKHAHCGVLGVPRESLMRQILHAFLSTSAHQNCGFLNTVYKCQHLKMGILKRQVLIFVQSPLKGYSQYKSKQVAFKEKKRDLFTWTGAMQFSYLIFLTVQPHKNREALHRSIIFESWLFSKT